MAILFLLSSIVSSLLQPIEPKSCESLMDIFETARSYFYNENYIEAYRLFYELEYTHNIKRTQSAWFQIQCFIRLGHWRQAIDKCHELQHLEPTMSHWYMIASDIYTDQLEFSLAWEELHKAILNTRDDAYFEICSNKRMLQEGRHLGIVRTDILNSILPFDIRCDIFKRLDLASLTKCTSVSKKWRTFLVSNGFLWNELYFDNKKKSVQLDMDTLHQYLERAKRVSKVSVRYQQTDGDGILMALAKYECYKLHTLVLSDIICTPGLFFNVLEYVGSTLKKLQWGGVSIRLNDLIDNLPKLCKNLTELTIHDCFTSLHDAQLIAGTLNRLEYFGEGFCPVFLNSVETLAKLNHIQQLELNGIHGLTASHLANILLRCPELVQLTLKRCLVNIIPVLNILRTSCPKLQYFEYERNRYCQQFDAYHPSYSNRFIHNIQQQPERLTTSQKQCMIKKDWIKIEIKQTNMLTDIIVHNLLYFNIEHLEYLDLSGNILLSDAALTKQSMRYLKELYLKECYGINERGIERIIQQSPLLEIISLSCLNVISNDILYALAKCEYLRKVDFSYCNLSNVSNEAIKYFIDQRKSTLKRCIFDYTTHLSVEALMYTIKNLKRGII